MSTTETMIIEVDIDDDDHQLETVDGSTWFVDPSDLATIATWLPTSNVVIIETPNGSMFSAEIKNEDGIVARAMRVN